MTRTLSPETKAAVAKAYAEGKLVKLIAAEHGIHIARPTMIAREMGVPMRQKRSKGVLRADIGRSLRARLQMAAKRQNTKPDIIVREALAAYLGGPSL